MIIRRTSLGLLLAVAAVASAAFVPPPAAAAAGGICSLVTTAEASAAMGVASLPGKERTSRHGSSCRYYSPNHQMNVFVQTVEAGDMTGAAQLGGKPVPGIGDKAIWSSGSLFIQKGAKFAQVGLYLTSASMQKMDPAIVKLAKAAASRM